MIKIYNNKNKEIIVGAIKGNYLLDNKRNKEKTFCNYEYFHEGLTIYKDNEEDEKYVLFEYNDCEPWESFGYIADEETVIKRIIELGKYSVLEREEFKKLKEIFEADFKKEALVK